MIKLFFYKITEFIKIENKKYFLYHFFIRNLSMEPWQHFYKTLKKSRLNKIEITNLNNKKKPIIVFSACQNKKNKGDSKFNGGIKLQNLWVKILRDHGYDAYIMTYDGKHANWLIDHQPHISYKRLSNLKNNHENIHYVTTWLNADSFINLADKIYYFDAEISHTLSSQREVLRKLFKKNKIIKVGTHSKTQVGWYLQNQNLSPNFINEWSDIKIWKQNSNKRVLGKIGYMNEEKNTKTEINEIKQVCELHGIDVDFIEINGDEKKVISQMQSCDIFLGMNQGKNILWGEGCPRSQQEAMHTGCAVIAYDVIGNREYIFDDITGCMIENKRSDLMALKIIEIINNKKFKEKIRKNGYEFIKNVFSENGKIKLLEKFLDLEKEEEDKYVANLDELKFVFKSAIFLTDSEVRSLQKYAKKTKGSILEIGAAYGASSSLLLAHSSENKKVFSIDPFIKDSEGLFKATANKCKKNVNRFLKNVNLEKKYKNWQLIEKYSDDAVKNWKRKIGLLFIDGNHKYDFVKNDFENWIKFIPKDGYILIHDSCNKNLINKNKYKFGWNGPSKLAKELRSDKRVKLIEESSSLSIWKKK